MVSRDYADRNVRGGTSPFPGNSVGSDEFGGHKWSPHSLKLRSLLPSAERVHIPSPG